jgi:hypothetical protein
MARRNYTVAEVEALIPSLEETFTRILQLRVGLRALEKKLERAGASVEWEPVPSTARGKEARSAKAVPPPPPPPSTDTDTDASPEASESSQVVHARALFRGYYEALSEGLEEIRAMGGDVKDLDLGLVDFPGRRGSDDILLCWRLGEKRIEYWHTVEGGFANRRRLDERIPRTPSRAD